MVVVNEGRGIGRTGRAFWKWVWDLEDLGVYVAVVKKDYDNSTPAGRSQMRKDADYAEEERELIRERTQGGIQEKAEDGLYPGGMVPFGWDVAERGKKGASHYVVHKEEAATLRRAREVFLEKRSWEETALILNSEKRLTRSGNGWTAKNIRCRLLGDAALESRVTWRGHDAQRDQDGNPIYGETVVINLPSIFTDEEVQELKSAMESRRPSTKTRSRIYLLTGLMTSPCGKTYEGHQHRPTEVIYRCKGRHESYAGAGDRCTCPYLEATSIEKQVWKDVMATLGDADRMKAMAQDWLNATSHKRMDYTKRIAELDQRIAETEDLIDITAATAAKRALRRGLSREEAEEAAERAAKPHEDELAGLEKLRREAEAWQREAAETGRWLQNLERLAEVAGRNLQDVEPAGKGRAAAHDEDTSGSPPLRSEAQGRCLRGTGVVRGRRPLRPRPHGRCLGADRAADGRSALHHRPPGDGRSTPGEGNFGRPLQGAGAEVRRRLEDAPDPGEPVAEPGCLGRGDEGVGRR